MKKYTFGINDMLVEVNSQQENRSSKVNEEQSVIFANPADTQPLKFKCANCNQEEVDHEGEWCDSCDLPDGDKFL